jgi:hypothetical protein
VNVTVTDELSMMEHNSAGFGSTGTKSILKHKHTSPSHHNISMNMPQPVLTTASAATLMGDDHDPICNIDLSDDPFNDKQTIHFSASGNHPTQGLILQDSETWNNCVQIISCQSGMAASKIQNWQSRLKLATLLEINKIPITTTAQARNILSDTDTHASIEITI